MVEKLDLLTRLNRQWGVGQIMITHTFKDLMCMETPAQNTKARGFVERSEIKVLGALSRIEVDRYLRGECGLPVSRREEDMLEDWATPVNFGSDASHKGLGRFLIKLGGLPGIPINVEMCPLEKAGSTIRTSNGTPRREPRDDRPPRHRHETHDPRRGTLRIPLRPARRAIPAAAADGQPQHSRLPPCRARRILMGLRNVDNPTEPKPYGNAETREPVWRETVDSATYGESRARVAHAVETFRIYDNTGILPETENQ